MADKPVIVQPGGLLSAASDVAAHLERSAAAPDSRHRRPSRSSPLEPSPSNLMAMCR
jgi:hypothetical protein